MSQESEQFMEQIQDMEEAERKKHKENKRNFVISCFAILFFAFFACLSVYYIATDNNRETFIPILIAVLVLMGLSIYYAVVFGRKYLYRQRDCEMTRRDRRVRAALRTGDEDFEEESDSRSSPSTDPAAEGPSNLAQTESSTLSEQTSKESSEKTSLSDSTKATFTTTAIIESAPVGSTSSDDLAAGEEKIASKNAEEGPQPANSSQPDSDDCAAVNADSEDDIAKVRHRRLTPEAPSRDTNN